MPAWRAFGTIAALVAAVLVAIVLHDRVFPRPLLHPANDFTTFYCSGEVVRQHADPYLVEPLRSCEQRRGEFSPSADAPWEVMPSPFPGYVLAIYALMSLLPYGAAHLAWLAVLLSGVGATIVFLRRLTGFAWLPLLAIAGVLLGFWNIDTSELTPVVSALLAYAALCARAGAWPRAGVFVALAMLIPHLTLPAFVALLLFAPAARPALLFTTAGLAALSVVTLGVGPNIEYFTRTLSTHARAEVWFPYQYSLTHLLARLGAAPELAILAGEISYFVLIALGVWAGHRLRSVGGDGAALVLLPPAIASVGGAFSHSVQIVSTVGAALLVAANPVVPRAIGVVPLVLYCVLWTGASSWRGLLVATTASAAAALWLTAGRITTAPLRRAALTLAGGLVMGALFVVLHRLPTQPPNVSIADARAPAIRGSDQAGRILQYRNELPQISALDLRIEIEKVPLVAGVLLLPACALAARERRFSRPVA